MESMTSKTERPFEALTFLFHEDRADLPETPSPSTAGV